MPELSPPLTREQRRLAALLLRQRGLDPSRLPIPRRSDPSRAPLSTTQRRLWTSAQSADGTSYGNVPMAFRVRGPLRIDVLERALATVVDRHEILRTTFGVEDGQPIQCVHPVPPVGIPVEDLRALPPRAREECFVALVQEQARRPFDPSADTLLRATAYRLEESDWGVVLVSHHLATDGWGARLLLDELTTAYRADVDGREPALPHLAVQYGDYAEWELEQLDDGAFDAQRRYWMERLAGAPRQLALPVDHPPSTSLATEWVGLSLSPDVSEDLRRFSRSRGVTPFATVLAGFKALLHRCTGQDDIVVGTILSRRTRSETEPLIGNFGNNLLLRTRLHGDPTLAEVVDRTAATLREALANPDVPLEHVAQAAPIPAFHVMFILRDGRFEERLAIPGVQVEGIDAASGAATLDLILDITDGSRGFEGHVEYRTARFEPETMRRFARALEDVITRMVREPDTRSSVLPRFEGEQRLEGIGPTRTPGEPPVTRTEKLLASLWREWLEIEEVYRNDNFFELGGDSLRAVYVLERAERELGIRLRPEALSRSTLRELAAACDGGAGAAGATVERDEPPLQVQRVDPLRFADPIKSLFTREGVPRHVDFFDRAYADAVAAGAASWIAPGEHGELIGHVLMLPHAFTCGDARYSGALGANLVFDRRHRNLTNAMALVERAIRDLERDGSVDFVFGDPNDDARAILASIGGFTDAGALNRFVLPVAQPGVLDGAAAVYLALRMRNGRRAPVEMERRAAVAFDPAEVEIPPGQAPVLRAVHPPALYRWRLEGYPAKGDDWYLFERDSRRVAALLVRRFDDGLAHLGAIWREPGTDLVSLLRPLVTELRSQGTRRLQAYSLRQSRLGRELRASGFLQREEHARFIVRPCSARGRALIEREVDWEITDLDCDRGLDR